MTNKKTKTQTKTQTKTNKSKITKNKKSKYKIKIKKIKGKGGGVFNTISKMVIQERRNTRTGIPIISKFLNIRKTLKSSSRQQFFQVIYHYGAPNEINIDLKRNISIPSYELETEPHIMINDIKKYLIALVERKPFSRLLWLVLFNLRSKSKTILSYLAPSPNKGEERNYSLLLYNLTDNAPIYTPVDLTTAKRKLELTNFVLYLSKNQQTIKPLTQYNKYFRVRGVSENVFSLFNGIKMGKQVVSNKIITKPEKIDKIEQK